jgi:hypothetical protein
MKNRFKQQGHVAVEWVIVTLVMVVALFAPIPGTEQSAVGLMMQSIRDFHASNSFLLSLP